MTARQDFLLQQHPLSAAFPSMPEADLQALAIDIKEQGQREMGVIYEGKVLDGWHRYLACQSANVPFLSEEFDGKDPVAFVRSKNWHRRHLTASQKAGVQVALHDWRKRGGSAAVADSKTTAEMAESAGVSPRTIEYAKTAEKAGLGEALREGQVTAERAAQIAKLPKGKRAKALTEPRPPRVISTDPKFERLYQDVKAELTGAKESLAEMADLAASAKSFEEKSEFKDMQNLRAELRAVKQRRDELMRENAELKKDLKFWKKKAGAK